MNNYKKEYFNDYCYFLLESNGDDIFLNYSLYNVISESKDSKGKKRIKKENLKNIEKKIQNFLKKNKKTTKSEIDELVDSDGTFLSSRIPILNKWLTPKKTMDQTIKATRTPGLTFIYGGGRRLYGENIECDNLKEINMKKTFGYDETEFKDLKDTLKTFGKQVYEIKVANPIFATPEEWNEDVDQDPELFDGNVIRSWWAPMDGIDEELTRRGLSSTTQKGAEDLKLFKEKA
jgi:hypothetical protein